MKPRLLCLDEMTSKAKELVLEHCDIVTCALDNIIGIYTQLTPITTNYPVFCPCTGIEHISSPDIYYLDDIWKQKEGWKITSTAEHTWSLILQLAKLNRMQLPWKSIFIIGYGRIGKQVHKYAKAFGLTVGYADIDEDWIDGLCAFDIVTLHMPLNEQTKGIFAKPCFDRMKDGALLINTSRAEIVNEYDLLQALESGKLGGYANDFDVLPNHTKVIATKHIGGNCIEAREATDLYIAEKIINYIRRQHVN